MLETSDQVTAALKDIADLDRQIDDLQEERDTHTGPLETAAMGYYEATGRPTYRRLGCARCYFVYDRVRGDLIVFTTDCSWCGKNGGEGLEVTAEALVNPRT